MKFVNVKDAKSEILALNNHQPIKVLGRDVCVAHNDTDS